jgi:hypothetical protein
LDIPYCRLGSEVISVMDGSSHPDYAKLNGPQNFRIKTLQSYTSQEPLDKPIHMAHASWNSSDLISGYPLQLRKEHVLQGDLRPIDIAFQ